MGWNLLGERYDEIREAVADLIEDWGISRYPFSIWKLLRAMGIRVIPYSALPQRLKEIVELHWPDAISVYPPDFNPAKTIIFYNDARDRFRIRFTLAHELAHLVLGHPDTGEPKYEDEADFLI